MISTLENFRPKLRSGQVLPQGSRIIFETENPYNQIVLPVELADLVLLCGGQFTIREIIEKIYKKQGSVPFKSVLTAVHLLQQGGFFENGDELILSSHLRSWMEPRRSRLHFSWRFGQRIVSAGQYPRVYYLATLALLVVSILGLQFLPSSPLTLARDWLDRMPPGTAFLQAFLVGSALQTWRYLVAGTQLLLLTGRAYNVSLRLSPWGLHLHIGDEANILFDHKLFTAMFHFSQILSPWAVAGLASVMLPSNVFTVILVISTFITVWELNPYVNSEIRKLIRVLLSSEERDVVSWHFETSTLINSMNPETRRQERRFIRLCTLGGVVWLTLIFALLHQAAITFGPSILKRLVHFDLATIPSAFGLVAWLITLYLVVQTLVETVTRDLIRPAWMACEVWWKKRRMLKHLNWSQPIISKRVEALPLFSHFHEQYLSMIIQDSELLSFAANQTIIRQGAPARDLFVLLEGQVEIIRMSPVGHEEWISELSAVSVFGESALLDELPRMAQVLTRKGCVVLRVPVATLRRVALEAQSVRQLEVFRNAIMVNQFFASSPVFRSLSYESIEFLSSRGTLEYFDKHQRVFHQGDTSDSLYLILRGSVSVEINGSLVKRLTQGSFFGEIALIANIPRTASITTAEPCVFFKISSDAFWEVLVQHMDLGVFIETVSESRLREDLALSIPPRRTGSDSF